MLCYFNVSVMESAFKHAYIDVQNTHIKNIMKKAIILLIILFYPISILAGWSGPVAVIQGEWGNKDGQFGLHLDYTEIDVPVFTVDQLDNIIIGDKVNNRILIYNSAGNLKKTFGPQLDFKIYGYWPPKDIYSFQDRLFIPLGEKHQVYNYDGQLINNFNYKETRLNKFLADGRILNDFYEKNIIKCKPNELKEKTYIETPLELGVVKRESLADGRYKHSISYGDLSYSVISKTRFFDSYVRDIYLNLYLIGIETNPKDIYIDAEWEGNTISETPQPHYFVMRHNPNNEMLDRVDMPANISHFRKTKTGVIRNDSLLHQYGKPFVAPNGDVYVWERTAKNFNIIKWTWAEKEIKIKKKVSTK